MWYLILSISDLCLLTYLNILSFKKYVGAVSELLFNISLAEGQMLKVDKSRAQSENDIISTDD